MGEMRRATTPQVQQPPKVPLDSGENIGAFRNAGFTPCGERSLLSQRLDVRACDLSSSAASLEECRPK